MTSKTSLHTLLASTSLLCLAGTAMADHQLAPDDQGWADIDRTINTARDGDTIRLSPGNYRETIRATENADCKTLRIVGTGNDPSDTVLQASCQRHHFGSWNISAERDLNYTFENITFAGHECSLLHPDRDGLLVSGANVQFINCRFVSIQSLYLDNVDQDPGEYDTYGALYLDSSTALFDNCEFYDNGLAFNRLSDYIVRAQGGAMYSYNSNVTINDSNFEGNYAITRGHATENATTTSLASGGAIYAFKGNLYIDNTRFHENEAGSYTSQVQPDEIRGGAISAINLDRLVVRRSDFEHNRAMWGGGAFEGPRGYGGAIYIDYWETYPFNGPGRNYLSDNRFYWNETDFTGGGVYVTEEAVVKIKRCEFECNTLEQVAGPWGDGGRNVFIEDCGPPCPADLNGDGTVDKYDMYVIFSLWGKVKTYAQQDVDFNNDGKVDNQDLIAWTKMAGECDQDDSQDSKYKK
jgi:hypothetical protein